MENHYDEAENYIFIGAKKDGEDWDTPGTYTAMTDTASPAELTDITETHISGQAEDHAYLVNGSEVLVLTFNDTGDTVVISDRSLNVLERQAIVKKVLQMQASQSDAPLMFFSKEANPEEFYYHGSWITFTEDAQDRNIVTIGNDDYTAAVYSVLYEGKEICYNADLENIYRQLAVQVDIIKKDKTDEEKLLQGAVFELRIVDGAKDLRNDGKPVYIQDDDGIITMESDPTAETTGLTSFDNLTTGIYEIVEKTSPPGYIKVTDLAVYFKIERGHVIWLNKDETKKPCEWQSMPAGTDTGWVTFEADRQEVSAGPDSDAEEARNAVFTVQNQPGAALPNTGGPGTRAIYMTGMMLLGLAGMVLVFTRRRRTA